MKTVGMHIAVATAYAVAGKVGLSLTLSPSASAVWPASGVALAALLVLGRRQWPGIYLGAFVLNLTTTASVPSSLVLSAGSTLAAVLGAAMVTRFENAPTPFTTTRDVFRFALLGCVASASVAATIAVANLYFLGVVNTAPSLSAWLTWWLGDASGAILVAPVIILWVSRPRLGWSRNQLIEFIAVSGSLGIAGGAVFLVTDYPIGFLCLVLCVWAALRFGQREAATLGCVLSCIAVWQTVQGRGVFSHYAVNDGLWLVQLFMATFAVTALAVGAAVSERALAEERLRTFNRALGHVVRERTAELRAALERATVSESRLAEAQQLAHIGSWEWVLADNSQTWSAELYRICGLEPDSLPATAELFSNFAHPDDRDTVRDVTEQVLRDHQPFECENRIIRPDGHVRTVNICGRVVFDDAGTAVRIVGTIQDVTDRHRLDEQVRQSQKMEAIGRLAAGIAHDFNNLLTPIAGYTELVLAQLDQDNPISHDMHEIRKAAESAAALTRQLLMFSRKQRPTPVAVDMNSVISTLEPLLCRTLGEDIRIVTHKASDLRWVYGDPSQLHQVLLNLAVNARDAMPTGGVLTIETANIQVGSESVTGDRSIPPGSYVRLSVSDTGHGMDAETQRRVFEPFFTTKGEGRGTGLGLATVAGIVEQLGGRLWLYSEIGHGTTFKVYVPATNASAHQPIADRRSITELCGSESILVVEDDDAVRVCVTTILRRHGYRTDEAATRADAFTILQQRRGTIDLMLADVIMPGMNVSELLRGVSERTRVLYMSGYSTHAIANQGYAAAHALLEKPFTSSDLLERVRDELDGAVEPHTRQSGGTHA